MDSLSLPNRPPVPGIFGRKTFLAGAALLFLAGLAGAEGAFTEVDVDGHRCLVSSAEGLPADAPVVLILHGYGTNGDEMTGLCGPLHLPPCLFVMPDGPLPAAHSASVDHAWYDRITHSRSDIERSRKYLFTLMRYFSRDYPDPPGPGRASQARPVILMGFSQGAVMTLEAGVTYPGKVLALACMSGYMPEPDKTLAHPAAPRDTPILMTHGTMDIVVQDDSTDQTLQALRKAGYHPILKEYPAGHHLTAGMILDVSQFLQRAMAHAKD